jgi:DNA-directed RNA polymerase
MHYVSYLVQCSVIIQGRMWWAESDEPWQTLACCIEIARAVKSGDPENYICHFPVHQDGSCNGLQHYAALGRDKAGAESVNLKPAACPQDVYSCVAALVSWIVLCHDLLQNSHCYL